MSYFLTFLLGLVISVLEPIAKKSKATWDDLVIRILKIVKSILSLGGFKK